jgi:protein-export membrane protein SecD
MIIWYRLPGLLSVVSLSIYLVLNLALFKLIPVTLTASGIAGFILSLGMAVDANVLIFERMKEELRAGANLYDAIKEGTKRAWTSIRDGNLTSIISAVVLYWMSGTSLVKGFALVFGLGVLVSMFTAITVSKIFLLAISSKEKNPLLEKFFAWGLKNKN